VAENSAQPRLIIVTGVSGAGHTWPMRVLEESRFYCVDNLPVALAATVAAACAAKRKDFAGVGARNRFARAHLLSTVAHHIGELERDARIRGVPGRVG